MVQFRNPAGSLRARRIRWALLLGVVCLAGYAWLIEPAWVDVVEHEVNTPQGGSPVRVVQLSDLHLRGVGRTEQRVLVELTALAPDVVLLTGDMVDRADSLPLLEDFLARLRSSAVLRDIPLIAAYGNWEYWGGVDLAALQALYRRHGVQLLVNACASIAPRGRPLFVLGLDDYTEGRPDLAKAEATCPATKAERLLVQHSPGYFEGAAVTPSHPVLFSVAGHTHGGQVTAFGKAVWTPPGSGSFNRGWYETSLGPLWVSKGIGTSVAPIRFGARPELVLFVIR